MALPMELYTASTAPSQGCAGQASRGDTRLQAAGELLYALSHGAPLRPQPGSVLYFVDRPGRAE